MAKLGPPYSRAISPRSIGVVERLPDADVVERGEVGVERQELDGKLGVGVQLSRVLKFELLVLGGRDLAEEPVGSSLLDRGHRVLHGRHGPPHDRVGVAGRLGGVGPLAEERVADEPDLRAADAGDLVRPGAGYGARPGFAVGCPGRDRCREGELGQLEQELGVGRGEVERDRPGSVVGDDAAGQVAAGRALGAGSGADEAGVQRDAGGSDAEQALDPAAEIAGPQRLAVGVADPRADPERVGRAAVGRSRDRLGKVGDEPQPVGTRALLEGDERVVGQPGELRVVGDVVERRIDRVDPHRAGGGEGRRGHDHQRPAAVAAAVRRRSHPQPSRAHGERRRGAADVHAGRYLVAARVDPGDGAGVLIGDPHRSRPGGQCGRAAPDRDRGRDRPGDRIDPGDGRVQAVGDP